MTNSYTDQRWRRRKHEHWFMSSCTFTGAPAPVWGYKIVQMFWQRKENIKFDWRAGLKVAVCRSRAWGANRHGNGTSYHSDCVHQQISKRNYQWGVTNLTQKTGVILFFFIICITVFWNYFSDDAIAVIKEMAAQVEVATFMVDLRQRVFKQMFCKEGICLSLWVVYHHWTEWNHFQSQCNLNQTGLIYVDCTVTNLILYINHQSRADQL